MNSRWIYNSH